jgi:hypothetical protein
LSNPKAEDDEDEHEKNENKISFSDCLRCADLLALVGLGGNSRQHPKRSIHLYAAIEMPRLSDAYADPRPTRNSSSQIVVTNYRLNQVNSRRHVQLKASL